EDATGTAVSVPETDEEGDPMRRTNLRRIVQTAVNAIALASLVRRFRPETTRSSRSPRDRGLPRRDRPRPTSLVIRPARHGAATPWRRPSDRDARGVPRRHSEA